MITTSITLEWSAHGVTDSITFEDETRSGWGFASLKDWWGQTDDKQGVTERPQGHGAFPVVRSLRSSRAPGFTAVYVGESQAELEAAFDRLASAGAEGPARMIVSTPAGSTWRTVTVETVAPEDHRGRSWGRAAVDMIARDPRRYATGAWRSTAPPVAGQGETWPEVSPTIWPGGGSPGRIALANQGTAPSSPILRLTGKFDSALITCVENGSRIGFARPVPAGSVVEIDVAKRTAVIDNQTDVSRWLRFREWVDVPGKQTRTFQFDAVEYDALALLTGKVDSAWW